MRFVEQMASDSSTSSFLVRGLPECELKGVSRCRPHDDRRGRRCFALTGHGAALGDWGRRPAECVLLLPLKDSVADPKWYSGSTADRHNDTPPVSVVCATSAEDGGMAPELRRVECRIVLVETSDSGWCEIVAVDTRFSSPSAAVFCCERRSFVLDLTKGEESSCPLVCLSHVPRGLRFPSANSLHGASSLLSMTLYGCDTRVGFRNDEWLAEQLLVVRDLLPERSSSMFDIVSVELVPSYGADWSMRKKIASSSSAKRRKQLHPALSTGTFGSCSEGTEPNSSHALDTMPPVDNGAPASCSEQAPQPPRGAIFEDLHHCKALHIDEAQCLAGVRSNVTAEFWTLTIDTDKCKNFILLLQLRSRLLPKAAATGDSSAVTLRVPIIPQCFTPLSTNGTFSIPVALPVVPPLTAEVFTSLQVQFMDVVPFFHEDNNLRLCRSSEGLDHLTLDTMVGHRGLGKTYTSSDSSTMQQKLAENSLESLNAAHARGCQCVEFDVMLTKDFVPIIFHDAVLQVDARGKQLARSSSGSSKRQQHKSSKKGAAAPTLNDVTPYDSLPVAVHQLTYRQLNGAVTKAYQELRHNNRLRELIIKHWVEILVIARLWTVHEGSFAGGNGSTTGDSALFAVGGSSVESASSTPPVLSGSDPFTTPVKNIPALLRSRRRKTHAAEASGLSPSRFVDASKHHRVITNHIPTLQELFDHTPPTLRLDLEVKFPFQPLADSHLYLQEDHFEINNFVNAILDVVFANARRQPEREIVFCSFEPDVCIALMLKQCRYHVLFLSDTEEHHDLKDYRSFEVETAIQFAHAHHLAGVSICAVTLMSESDKQLIPVAADLKSWTKQIAKLAGPRVPSLTDTTILADEMMAERWSSISTDHGRHLVACAHRHNLKVWTWGDRNSDPYFAFLQAQEMHVDAVISDNVPLWSNASVGVHRRPRDHHRSESADQASETDVSSAVHSDQSSPVKT